MHVPKRKRRALQASFYTHKMILPQSLSEKPYRVMRTFDERIVPVGQDASSKFRSTGKYYRKTVFTGSDPKKHSKAVRMTARAVIEFQPPVHPPMKMASRPQDWAEPARSILFGQRNG